jgi:hypothetical protein
MDSSKEENDDETTEDEDDETFEEDNDDADADEYTDLKKKITFELILVAHAVGRVPR